MSFLKRLFGKKKSQPKVVDKKPAVNLELLSLEALVKVIQSGDDEPLRIAALQKITDQQTLLAIAGIDGAATVNASIAKAAKQRLIELVDAGAINSEQLCRAINDKMALISLLSLSSNVALFEAEFNRVEDQTELARFALEGATSKLRQRAAEKISDKAVLLQLLKDAKTKDKTVFKIVKEKCDAFKEEEKRAVDVIAALSALVQALEQQAKRPFDAQYAAKVHYLQQQWDAQKNEATSELAARAQAAIAGCQSVINSISAEQAAQEAERRAAAQADAERKAHIEQLQSVLVSIVSSDINVDETQALLKLLDSAWAALAELKKPTAAEQKTVAALRRIIQDELAHYKAHGSLAQHRAYFESQVAEATAAVKEVYLSLKSRVNNLRESFAEALPETIAAAQSAYEQWEQVAAEKSAQLQAAQRQLGGLIRKANETVSAGVLGKAMGIRRAIDEKLQELEQLPSHLAGQLEQLDAALAKLQDWKSYAVLPKKHELIAQLEALEGSREHPEALATKIKRIQDEWRSLSKGAKDQDQELWEKFHELAQKVYQPCRDYFAEQANIRQRNLAACKQLVAQLQDYLVNYDWAAANWKDVEKVMRVARQEWRNYTPTERAATQPVLAEFDAALAAIQQKLHDEYARNAQLKKQLIAQAQELVGLDDSRKATDEVKQLQARWQTIGASLRKEEQQLWHEFRDVCDAVFAKRNQQSAEFKAELEANLAAAKALVVELHDLQGLDGQALMDARKRADEIRASFGGLGQFPKAQVADIKAAFGSAVDAFEQKLKAERVALKQQVWVNLFAANSAVNTYELALVQGKSASAEAVQAQLDAISQWPAGGLKAIQQKLARANSTADLQQNLAALRELCIRAEILSDSPSPAAEHAERTAFQVNQLQQNFGRKAQDAAAEMENLVFDWVAVGAVETAAYDALFARFNSCRLKLSH